MADRKDGMVHISVPLSQGLAGLMANWPEEAKVRLLEAIRADGGSTVEEAGILEDDSMQACEEHALEHGLCDHGDAFECDMC